MSMAMPHCLAWDRQAAWRALSRAWAKTGKRMAASIAMIAITTRSSIRVKPRALWNLFIMLSFFRQEPSRSGLRILLPGAVLLSTRAHRDRLEAQRGEEVVPQCLSLFLFASAQAPLRIVPGCRGRE